MPLFAQHTSPTCTLCQVEALRQDLEDKDAKLQEKESTIEALKERAAQAGTPRAAAGRGGASSEGHAMGSTKDGSVGDQGGGEGGEAFKIFIKYGDKTKRARVEACSTVCGMLTMCMIEGCARPRVHVKCRSADCS